MLNSSGIGHRTRFPRLHVRGTAALCLSHCFVAQPPYVCRTALWHSRPMSVAQPPSAAIHPDFWKLLAEKAKRTLDTDMAVAVV